MSRRVRPLQLNGAQEPHDLSKFTCLIGQGDRELVLTAQTAPCSQAHKARVTHTEDRQAETPDRPEQTPDTPRDTYSSLPVPTSN